MFCKAKAFESQLNQEVEKKKEKQRKEVLRIEIERTVWLVENINKNGFRLNCVGFFGRWLNDCGSCGWWCEWCCGYILFILAGDGTFSHCMNNYFHKKNGK